MIQITDKFLRPLLLYRNNDSHKYNYGHALLVCGCERMPGAAVLATGAALKSGCGLVSLHSTATAVSAAMASNPSAMLSRDSGECFSKVPENLNRYDAIGVGPGLGREECTVEALKELLSQAKKESKTMVLDADALNIIAEHPDLLTMVPAGSVLTPHSGELRRLSRAIESSVHGEVGASSDSPSLDDAAMRLAERLGCVVVSKGWHTKVFVPTDSINVFENTTGNAGLAKGGSGDVLTGLITGLIARGYKAADAALLGVWLHGYAGDCLTKDFTAEAWNSQDLLPRLYEGFKLLYL